MLGVFILEVQLIKCKDNILSDTIFSAAAEKNIYILHGQRHLDHNAGQMFNILFLRAFQEAKIINVCFLLRLTLRLHE